MLILTRSEAKDWQPLAQAGSSRANLPGWPLASSSDLPQQSSLEVGVNYSDTAFESRPSNSTVGNERPLAFCTWTTDCLDCPALIQKNVNLFLKPQAESILPLLLNPMKFAANFKDISTY